MAREYYEVEVHHRGECACESFLSPVTTWKEVAQRHKSQDTLIKSLVPVAEIDDYIIDLFRCADCGRYWAREDVGRAWLTKSYPFFYLATIAPDETPKAWLTRQQWHTVLSELSKNEDNDYHTLIAPHLPLKSDSRRNPKNNR